ncbi:MAG: hypothetical protein WD342_12490 [Verrucomicrobiales bacterium]
MKDTPEQMSRRALLRGGAGTCLAGGLLASSPARAGEDEAAGGKGADAPREFRLGLVTEGVAADWTLEEMLLKYERFGFDAAGVVLGRGHGISLEANFDARRQFLERTTNKTDVDLFSIETPCTLDPATAEAHVALAAEHALLAFETNTEGIVVRPCAEIGDGQPASAKRVDEAGDVLKAMAEAAAAHDREIWLEMSGDAPGLPATLRKIVERCDHPAAGIAWNCRIADVRGGSVAGAFDEVREHLRCVHLGELWTAYPYADLFRLLRESGYDRYTLARIPATPDPERVLRYYRRLWEALSAPGVAAPGDR